ncbi:MAG: hypothetical protein J7M25_04315 [Deltaproteobacteria bacterium]|nr:hypothetical protein [Deltaproteobacteria bacterium]
MRQCYRWGLAILMLGTMAACGPAKSNNHEGWNVNTNDNSNNGNNSDGGTIYPDAYVGPAAKLQGTVWGPGKLFPVSGAIVAAYTAPPEAIPDHVYCEPCAEPGVAHVFSNPDGSFELSVMPGGHFWLSVQKGQFRHVQEYSVPGGAGTYVLTDDYTTLPSRTDPDKGDTIPKIALATGSYDHMEDIFGKVGMGSVDPADGTFDWGSEQGIFDVYDNGGDGSGPSFSDLLHDVNKMEQYHIIFVPCSDGVSDYTDSDVQDNMKQYVWDGGKWYIADWSEEWVNSAWPEFLDFGNCGSDWGTGDELDCDGSPEYDSVPGHALDPDLAAWLAAQGISPDALSLEENWDEISGIHEGFVGYDPEHGQGPNHELYMLPRVWVEGPVDGATRPLTVSWPYNCGRVLYTTYHSVGAMGGTHSGLLPQEEILFYLVMEIGLCQDEVVVQ